MPFTHYSQFSVITLRIWVFKSGVLKTLFILSKHGTKANIRSTKMANNRHAYNRDVLQSYWTSDGLLLYCSQPTGEKTHTNQQCDRLAKIRQTDDSNSKTRVRFIYVLPEVLHGDFLSKIKYLFNLEGNILHILTRNVIFFYDYSN
jgi:hypothetical protein